MIYFTQHPRSLRGVLEANLNVDGERRLRSRLRNRDPGRPWMSAPRRNTAPRVASLTTFPRSAGVGRGVPGSRREPRSRRSGAPFGEAVLGSGRGRSPCLIRTVSTPAPYGALLPLFGSEDGLRPFGRERKEETARDGAANENQDGARAGFRSENDGACLPQ